MSLQQKVLAELYRCGFDSEMIHKTYYEPNRFYHNWNHIMSMMEKAEEQEILTDALMIAIAFHDIVYDPKRDDNEEKSVEFLELAFMLNPYTPSKYSIEEIKKAILRTKTHTKTSSELSNQLISLDLGVFKGTMQEQVVFEKGIFKEYQFVDWRIYREKRLQVLERYNATEEHKNYLKFYEPKIGVFAGSFNPFHVGHLNILEKAEKIFDKVIIASGLNPEKAENKEELPLSIQNRQIECYDGLLTDFLKELDYPVTLIRGLRDANDLLYESNQICFLKELMPEISVIEILCDKKYSHISSSSIRQLQKYGVERKYLVH